MLIIIIIILIFRIFIGPGRWDSISKGMVNLNNDPFKAVARKYINGFIKGCDSWFITILFNNRHTSKIFILQCSCLIVVTM